MNFSVVAFDSEVAALAAMEGTAAPILPAQAALKSAKTAGEFEDHGVTNFELHLQLMWCIYIENCTIYIHSDN